MIVAGIQVLIFCFHDMLLTMVQGRSLRGGQEELARSALLALQHTDDLHLVEHEMTILEKFSSGVRYQGYEENQDPIDNYYSRQHIVPTEQQKPVLIVGGSDGSGTRAFVEILGRLGTPMLVDDSASYDVHAEKMFNGRGWPPLVQLILESTATANYEFGTLPDYVKDLALPELEGLRQRHKGRAEALLSQAEANKRDITDKVSFGFKAPVTMLLLPLLRHVYGPIKFLHVVRDGRDVALSSNQSPVKKFYNYFYPDGLSRRQEYEGKKDGPDDLAYVLAMQLWNDWNTQVYDWGLSHNDGVSFDYLVVRSEDLLDPRDKFNTLRQLSDFVGSKKTEKELCCLSRQALVDMGQSANVSGGWSMSSFQQAFQTASRDAQSTYMANHFASNIEVIHTAWNQALSQLDKPFAEVTESLQMIKRSRPELYEKIQFQRLKNHAEKLARRELRFRSIYIGGADEDRRRLRESKVASERDGFGRIENLLALSHGKRAEQVVVPGWKPPVNPDNLVNDANLLTPIKGSTTLASRDAVKKRYGKWAKRLQDRPRLSRLLHEEGKQGLETFGYEPPNTFLDHLPTENGFVCDERVLCED